MMRKILGLDLGTNSIGWAVVNAEQDKEGKEMLKGISCANSRIIPMTAEQLGNFDKGNTVSQTAERTKYRGMRRLLERYLLRRERLLRVLDKMNWLPKHYSSCLTRYGKFKDDVEVRLAWKPTKDGKYEFIFQESFNEMLADFAKHQPELVADGKKIPYDWTIYYLRKKALTQKVSNEELAWILLQFNRKRGYNQLRGEEEEIEGKREELVVEKVVNVIDSGEKKGKNTKYDVVLANGMVYTMSASMAPDWIGKTKEFIVTTTLNPDGTDAKDKDGNVKRSFRLPKEGDWTLVKKRTEATIGNSGKTVGEYVYDAILSNPSVKILGSLVATIDRKFYKQELRLILDAQKKFNPALTDKTLYKECIEVLYQSNEEYRQSIAARDMTYLLIDNILFYQRPLKSKKSLIDDCQYETTIGKDPNTGEQKEYPVKCIAKSNPLFQEFRLWQWLQNLRIINRDDDKDDITSKLLKTEDDITALFDWLNDQPKITQKALLGYKPFNLKNKEQYRWNYVEDKEYPCNETRAVILACLKKAGIDATFLTREREEQLWHILYSISDKTELRKALEKYAKNNSLESSSFVSAFERCKPFDKEYGSYSAKAIKKFLPLMRTGKYWAEESIDSKTRERIENIRNGIVDDSISSQVREKTSVLTRIEDYKYLPIWMAGYIVYGRHSEAKDMTRWEKPEDIDEYLKNFRQHSLRNPVVEQVVMETLRVVRDIWKQEGHIDEIHVELGREMKNPADKRKKMSEQIQRNEDTNLRVKTLLMEFMNPDMDVDDVRPFSPSQLELLRIYEEGVVDSVGQLPDDIKDIQKKIKEAKKPSHSDFIRYKTWLDQKYISPYTGQPIPLGKLFTHEYEIEHVIPQSRYFDDSMSNKVICESAVNKLKSNMLGMEFIKQHHGEKVQCGGKTVTILEVSQYEQHIRATFGHNQAKMKKLMLEEIPEDFIQRQMNDSRYISRLVISLLSKIVREDNEVNTTSKNVIVCTGGVTDRLKKDWGVNDVWNSIILPRFRRMNEITGNKAYTAINANGHEVPTMPLELSKGFNKKRIDHRHHAMDAIVIACAGRNIVNYLNNASALSGAETTRHDLQTMLCTKKNDGQGNYKWLINMPWGSFAEDMRATIEQMIVSFKQNLRVINKSSNKNVRWNKEKGKKEIVAQTNGNNWAIRKSMHKETVFGDVNLRFTKRVKLADALQDTSRIVDAELRSKIKDLVASGADEKKIKSFFEEQKEAWQEIDLKKIEVYYYAHETSNERYYATRKSIDTSFTREKILGQITDTGIQAIMLKHLEACDNDPEIAFSADGIDVMNSDIEKYNNGKKHQPIHKVRVYEKSDMKFAVGETGNKGKKFVEAAAGTNLFFAVYENEEIDKKSGEVKKVRSYESIALNEVTLNLKQSKPIAPVNKQGVEALFTLSPNDLVYVPKKGEKALLSTIDSNRIYRMVSCTGNECYFVKYDTASVIVDKVEYQSLNKMGRAITGEMIKEVCIPIKTDRLGNIIKIGY